jgi:ribokinase
MVRKAFEVCVVGSLNMDTVHVCDSLARNGHFQAKHSSDPFPGGIGANHAMAIHRMSHARNQTPTSQGHDANLPFEVSVSIIGKVGGKDDHGKTLKDLLGRNNIHTQAVTTAKEQRTGIATIWLQEDNGQSRISNVPNANSQLLPADVESAWPASDTDLVVVSLEIPPVTASKAVTLARKHKVPVILNLTPEPEPNVLNDNELFVVDHLIMNDRDADKILALSPMDDNARRKKSLLQTRYSDAANRFHQKGASYVIITLGEMGALASYVVPEHEEGAGGQKLWFFGAQAPGGPQGGPRRVRDVTGASDAFVGAYAVEILRQLHDERATGQSGDISTALDMAIKAGGFSVGMEGGMEGCPWRDQIVGGDAFVAVNPFQRRRRG